MKDGTTLVIPYYTDSKLFALRDIFMMQPISKHTVRVTRPIGPLYRTTTASSAWLVLFVPLSLNLDSEHCGGSSCDRRLGLTLPSCVSLSVPLLS